MELIGVRWSWEQNIEEVRIILYVCIDVYSFTFYVTVEWGGLVGEENKDLWRFMAIQWRIVKCTSQEIPINTNYCFAEIVLFDRKISLIVDRNEILFRTVPIVD